MNTFSLFLYFFVVRMVNLFGFVSSETHKPRLCDLSTRNHPNTRSQAAWSEEDPDHIILVQTIIDTAPFQALLGKTWASLYLPNFLFCTTGYSVWILYMQNFVVMCCENYYVNYRIYIFWKYCSRVLDNIYNNKSIDYLKNILSPSITFQSALSYNSFISWDLQAIYKVFLPISNN